MTALILAAATFVLGSLDDLGGRNLLNRPLVTSTVVGLILGDLNSGLMIGAVLELAFIGLFAVGAAIPPEILTGGILGTAFAISSGGGAESALVLAFPVAAIGLIIKNVQLSLITPMFLHRADRHAASANFRGVARMHFGALIVQMGLLSALVGIAYGIGAGAVSSVLHAIPEWVQTGLQVATGILPALGFALLARMIMSRRVMPYFFIGFLLVAYLEIPVVGIAALGVMIAWIMVGLEARQAPPEPQAPDDSRRTPVTPEGDLADDF